MSPSFSLSQSNFFAATSGINQICRRSSRSKYSAGAMLEMPVCRLEKRATDFVTVLKEGTLL